MMKDDKSAPSYASNSSTEEFSQTMPTWTVLCSSLWRHLKLEVFSDSDGLKF